jgi:hypothetical protein
MGIIEVVRELRVAIRSVPKLTKDTDVKNPYFFDKNLYLEKGLQAL